MSICLSVHPSISPSDINSSEFLYQAYQQLSLTIKPINHQAHWPSSLSTFDLLSRLLLGLSISACLERIPDKTVNKKKRQDILVPLKLTGLQVTSAGLWIFKMFCWSWAFCFEEKFLKHLKYKLCQFPSHLEQNLVIILAPGCNIFNSARRWWKDTFSCNNHKSCFWGQFPCWKIVIFSSKPKTVTICVVKGWNCTHKSKVGDV